MQSPKQLKKHKYGFETEFFIIENDGRLSDRADELIVAIKKKAPKIAVEKEYTYHMIEIASNPHVNYADSIKEWLEMVSRIIDIADKLGLKLYPYGTYPGFYEPKTRTGEIYKVLEDLKSPEQARYCAGHVSGFHLHYCLPYGTFDKKEGQLKKPYASKNKDLLISIHNSIVAADPAFTTFMSSSPFVDLENHVMDTRNMLYRDMVYRGPKKKIVGQYHGKRMFGALPSYAFGISELTTRVELMQKEFLEHAKEKFPQFREKVRDRHAYALFWGPIRITRYGTIEYRGMDMNLPSYFISTGNLMKMMFERIMNEKLMVLPSDTGVLEPFTIEGNILHVPPYAHVAGVLQKKSAVDGTDCHEIRDYIQRIASFALDGKNPKKIKELSRVSEILETGKTRSDIILKDAVNAGWTRGTKLKEEIAQNLALSAADMLEKEVENLLNTK